MSILDYRKNAKQLRQVNRALTKEDLLLDEFKKNLHVLEKLLRQDGVGLAAPQIGWNVKLFILCIDEDGKDSGLSYFLNPQILKKSKEIEKFKEGCLSLPGLYLNILRPITVEWEFYDLNMEKHYYISTGFHARAVSHEIDHLNGKLMIDLCGNVQQLKVQRWLHEKM